MRRSLPPHLAPTGRSHTGYPHTRPHTTALRQQYRCTGSPPLPLSRLVYSLELPHTRTPMDEVLSAESTPEGSTCSQAEGWRRGRWRCAGRWHSVPAVFTPCSWREGAVEGHTPQSPLKNRPSCEAGRSPEGFCCNQLLAPLWGHSGVEVMETFTVLIIGIAAALGVMVGGLGSVVFSASPVPDPQNTTPRKRL